MDVDIPRWAAPGTLLLAAIGLLLSGYLTVEHYTRSVALVCPESGIVNCSRVTNSPQSELLGIPVAVLGLVYFAVLLPLMLPASWRRPSLRLLRLGAVATGLPVLAYLIHAETVLRAICLYCTGVHVVTLMLLVVTVLATALSEQTADAR